jgi:Na+/melibiose symporter-like transporter
VTDLSPPRTPLPKRTLVLYGLPNLSFALTALPLALFVPAYYADDLGLPLAQVGAAIAASRALDLVTDPLMGQLSDRVRTRLGRRKPWIALGAPLLVASLWQLFVPGARGDVGVSHLLVWTALLFVGVTLVDVPFKAWGAELSTDYAERSRVTAWREAFGFAGQIGLLLLLLVLGRAGIDAAGDQLRWCAVTIVLGLPPLVSLALWFVPEPPPERATQRALAPLRGWLLVLRNPAFGRMVGAVLCFVSGVVVQGTLHRLVLEHVFARADLFPPMILLENLVTLAAVPLWLRVSDRLGKHRAVALAALWLGALSLPVPLFGPGQGVPFVVLMVVRGASFASILFLASSMAADAVDHDMVTTGQQRTGLYFGVYGMVIKGSLALGVVLATSLPAAFGFEPRLGAPTGSATLALMAIYAWLPGLLMAAGGWFLWNFPITREAQLELRAELAARSSS